MHVDDDEAMGRYIFPFLKKYIGENPASFLGEMNPLYYGSRLENFFMPRYAKRGIRL